MVMSLEIKQKEEAKPKQFSQLEPFTTYRVHTQDVNDGDNVLNHIVVKLVGGNGYVTALLDCTTGKLITNEKIKFLTFLRDFTIRAIQLVYDETDKPSV